MLSMKHVKDSSRDTAFDIDSNENHQEFIFRLTQNRYTEMCFVDVCIYTHDLLGFFFIDSLVQFCHRIQFFFLSGLDSLLFTFLKCL